MSKLVAFAFVVLAAVSTVGAAPIFPRQNVSGGWDSETQEGYNTRFLELGCQNQQNTKFFDDCCRPLKQGQILGNNCSNPSSALSGAPSNTLSEPPSSQTPEPISVRDTGDDCEDDDGDDEDDDDTDDDDESCDEDEDNDPSSSPVNEPTSSGPNPDGVPQPTPTPTSSPNPSPSSPPDNVTPPSILANSETHPGGQLTWYKQDGKPGACGKVNSDSDFIVALDQRTYGNGDAVSPYCGKTIRITWEDKYVDAVVADDCPSCKNAASVDLSKAVFEVFAPLDVGELDNASWTLL